MGAGWRIELMGGLRAVRDDCGVPRVRSQKAGALLAYLSYFRQRSHPRELLIEMFWPHCAPQAGRRNLRVELTALRHLLERPIVDGGSLMVDGPAKTGSSQPSTPPASRVPDYQPFAVLLADHATVRLSAECTTDVAQFEAALQAAGRTADREGRAQLLTQAVELRRGELLPGYFEGWIMPERQRLEELFFQALLQLIGHFEQRGDLDRALETAHRAVSADPLREDACHELIRLCAAVGQPQLALRHYRELEERLRRDLNGSPTAATRTLARAIAEDDEVTDSLTEKVDRSSSTVSTPPLRWPASTAEPVGGAVPLGSPFYVVRPTDRQFETALARQDSIVLVKGTRQVGKTSLLARGFHQARQSGARVVVTDFEALNRMHLESADALLLTLAHTLADQLDLRVSPHDVWDPRRGPNPNFRRYLEREVLRTLAAPLVWGLDQVDRLFACEFGPELFALFRSWHNERALDPSGPWSRLTLAIAYSTEVHLFITDLDQSPFNVGTRLTLDDFTREQTSELNRRCGAPLKDEAEISRFHDLLGGHPYLVRRGLHEMTTRGIDLTTFEAHTAGDHGFFGDHLRRVLVSLARDSELCEAVRAVLEGRPCPTLESFFRLRSAGVVTGLSDADARLRCPLYAMYLARHLG
jgi:DNA-binding SARP family transcriptional activator